MPRRCPPGVFCIENVTIVFICVIFVILGLFLYFMRSSSNSSNKSSSSKDRSSIYINTGSTVQKKAMAMMFFLIFISLHSAMTAVSPEVAAIYAAILLLRQAMQCIAMEVHVAAQCLLIYLHKSAAIPITGKSVFLRELITAAKKPFYL